MTEHGTELATIDRFRQEVEALATLPDALLTASQLDVLRHALKKAGHSQRIQNEAGALKLRAERRAGELIADIVPEGSRGNFEGRTTYADIGIKKDEGTRLRKLAHIPLDVFDDYLANAYARGDEITRTGVLKLAPVTKRTNIATIDYVAPSITNQLATSILGDIGEIVEEAMAASLTKGLHELVEQGRTRQALIWSKYHGVSESGEQGERWSFAGIARMIPNEKGEPSTREYIEGQYYRAQAWMMSRLASDGWHHVQVLAQDLV